MKPLNEMTLDEKLAAGCQVWCRVAGSFSFALIVQLGSEEGEYIDIEGGTYNNLIELTLEDLIIPPPRWEDSVSPENPVTCWVSGSHMNPGPGDSLAIINSFDPESDNPYRRKITHCATWGITYATPVKPGELPILGEE